MPDCISQLLQEQYGIAAAPGRGKLECPTCRHKTLSVKANDAFAKCFHSSCGAVFSSSRAKRSIVADSLEEIITACRQELRSLGNESEAWNFLLEQRHLDRGTCLAAGVGAVPAHLATVVEAAFGARLIRAREAIERQKTEKAPKKKIQEAEEHLALVEGHYEAARKLAGNVGWIVFPYRDKAGAPVSLKLRNPLEKRFLMLSTQRGWGVFGAELSGPAEQHQELIVCEGEINTLRLQSLLERTGRGYTNIVSFGGAGQPDAATIYAACRKPTLWQDNDEGGEGAAALLQMKGSLWVTKSPRDGEDLDDFIGSYPTDEEALAAVVDYVTQRRVLHTRDFRGVREEVESARKMPDTQEFERNQAVTEIVTREVMDRGSLIKTSTEAPYIFDETERFLIPLPFGTDTPLSVPLTNLLKQCGIVGSESITRYVAVSLAATARIEGRPVELHELVHYDHDRHVIYWNCGKGCMFRIRADGHEQVPNGTDGVLFLSNGARPWNYVAAGKRRGPGLDGILFEGLRFQNDAGQNAEQSKLILRYWIQSMFFPSIMHTRPIMLMLGEKGSGKSLFFKKLGLLLYGPDFSPRKLPTTEEGAETLLTNNYFTLLDNVDKSPPWLEDLLAIVATGGQVSKRRLYSDNELLSLVFNTFLAITARTPRFRRDDVADRLIVTRVDRLGDEGFMQESVIVEQVNRLREELCSELLDQLVTAVSRVKETHGKALLSPIRSSDFGGFVMRLASGGPDEAQAREALVRVARAQNQYVTEEDPTVELLLNWIRVTSKESGGQTMLVTARQLHTALAAFAAQERSKFSFLDNPKGFADFLKRTLASLKDQVAVTMKKDNTKTNAYMFHLLPSQG